MLGLVVEHAGWNGLGSMNVPDLASDFNRLLQTGIAAYTTKTSGSYGEDGDRTVSLGIVGNAHPVIVVPMMRGTLGVNHVAVRERFLLVTGPIVEPHHPIPYQVSVPGDFQRWLWPRLLNTMIEPLGFPDQCNDPVVAAQKLKRAAKEDDDGSLADEQSAFVPDAQGFAINFADGTPTRLRFRKVSSVHLVPEFRIPNRDIPISPEDSLDAAAQRVLDAFEIAGLILEFTPQGRLAFEGFRTAFTTKCAATRNAAQAMAAARLGIGPWHLAMLSAGLFARILIVFVCLSFLVFWGDGLSC